MQTKPPGNPRAITVRNKHTPVGKAGKGPPSGQQQGTPSAQQQGTPVPSSNAHQCPAAGHTSAQQLGTKDNNINNNKDDAVKTPDTASDLDNLANNLGSGYTAKRAVQTTQKDIEASPLRRALRLCNLTPDDPKYLDNARIFSSVINRIEEKHPGRSMEVIITLESEQRQGELDGIKHMPRYVTSRLNDVLEST